MKRLLSSLVVALSFIVLSTGSVFAEHYWTLEMFQPTGAITGNTFPVEYKAFSIEDTDQFAVTLFQNGEAIGTQNTTKANGDSGVFNVTVPGPGTYKYHLSATSSVDGEGSPKTTEDRTMTVTQTPSGTVTTVFVNQPGGAVTAAAQGGGAGAAGANAAAAGGGGQVAGATANGGQTNAEGQSATTDKNGDVLGAEKKNDSAKSNAGKWWIVAAVAALAAVGSGGYYYIQRSGNNPFSRSSSE